MPLIIDTVTAARGHVAAGKLKALAITTLKPTELLPGVKSVAEQGCRASRSSPGTRCTRRRARRRTIVDQLNAEVDKILAQPETRQRLMDLGFEPAGGTPEQLAGFERRSAPSGGR